jgi:hypothetical protein
VNNGAIEQAQLSECCFLPEERRENVMELLHAATPTPLRSARSAHDYSVILQYLLVFWNSSDCLICFKLLVLRCTLVLRVTVDDLLAESHDVCVQHPMSSSIIVIFILFSFVPLPRCSYLAQLTAASSLLLCFVSSPACIFIDQ